MTTRVGVAVAHDAVRAVAVRGERVVWAAEAPLDRADALGATLTALLAEAPLSRWSRPGVAAAVGPHASQVKCLAGLPPVADAEALAAIVRESSGTFFLRNGVPLLTTGVRPTGDGTALAAAIDLPCVDAVRQACRARGWRFTLVVPAAVALARAVEDQIFAWTDGKVAVEISQSDGALQSARSVPTRTLDAMPPFPRPLPALAAVGEEAARYAAAYGAAVIDLREPLALNALSPGLWSLTEFRRRFILPGAVLVAAIVALALSPLGASWAARRAENRVREVPAEQWHTVNTSLAQLRRVTAILDDVRAFAESRGNVTRLVGELARVLPAGSALMSLELDGDRVDLVVLAREPAAVLSAVRGLPAARAVELVGPARHEPTGGPNAQRVAIRFQIRGSP